MSQSQLAQLLIPGAGLKVWSQNLVPASHCTRSSPWNLISDFCLERKKVKTYVSVDSHFSKFCKVQWNQMCIEFYFILFSSALNFISFSTQVASQVARPGIPPRPRGWRGRPPYPARPTSPWTLPSFGLRFWQQASRLSNFLLSILDGFLQLD